MMWRYSQNALWVSVELTAKVGKILCNGLQLTCKALSFSVNVKGSITHVRHTGILTTDFTKCCVWVLVTSAK